MKNLFCLVVIALVAIAFCAEAKAQCNVQQSQVSLSQSQIAQQIAALQLSQPATVNTRIDSRTRTVTRGAGIGAITQPTAFVSSQPACTSCQTAAAPPIGPTRLVLSGQAPPAYQPPMLPANPPRVDAAPPKLLDSLAKIVYAVGNAR